ncbi:histidine kinase [Leptospira hartskeerlii]|uniref:histidine kinase n=1 Tax=Leptospira hartskeerlii TaxID=2023177 RepID=A0A2M9XFI5_9LEPT|nr:PAS domain S-box protein [Leptospira hartskeerlii]PJZ26471.1 histidine kinase [Leptospira hartskeerlii]PJZ34553.1 histidine kinase [Leptospira hartskeerlii]
MALAKLLKWFQNRNLRKKIEKEIRALAPEVFNDYLYRVDVLDNGNLILSWANEGFLKFCGISAEDLNQPWAAADPKYFHQDDLDMIRQRVRSLLSGSSRTDEYRVYGPDGQIRWLRDHAHPIWDPVQKRVSQIYGSIQDLTPLRKSEIILQDQLSYTNILLDSTEEWVIRVNQTGKIQYVNSSGRSEVRRQFGIELLPDSKILSLISETHREIFQAQLNKAFSGAKVKWHFSKLFPVQPNSELEVSFAPLSKEGTIKEVVIFLKDVTLRTVWETALLASEEKYRKLVEVSPDAIGLHADGKVIYINQTGLKMLGYESMEEVEGRPIAEFIHPDSRQVVAERVLKAMLKSEPLEPIEEKFIRKDGTEISVEVSGVAFEQRGQKLMQVIVRDITERKKAELELSELRKKILQTNDRLQAIIEGVKESICAVDMDLRVISCNTAFELMVWKLYGKRITVGQSIWDIAIDNPEEKERIIRNWSRALTGEVFKMERKISGLIKDSIVLEINYSSIRDESHNMIGATQIIRDVTDRYQYEETLRKSLEEKEVMLKEIHHRVKNNLQVVSSLLSLQTDFTDDPKLVSILKECERRIQSMALVHKELYQNDTIADADFTEYLNNLLVALVQSYGANKKVGYSIESQDIRLNLDFAIPLALVFNELVSNSLKYAFPGDRKGEIFISISKKDNGLSISIGDNGVGLPKNVNVRNSEGLGLQLVGMLLDKLKAKWGLETVDIGTRYKIELPIPK